MAVAVAVVAAACGGGDDASVAAPGTGDRRPWGSFSEGVLEVDTVGELLRWCVLVADIAAEHSEGLMNAPGEDLGGYDGMAFDFAEERVGGFWMKDTEVPLSIAYVDTDGEVVSTADMAPCPPEEEHCPSYPPAGPYRLAVEVPQGRLADLGIVDSATVVLRPGPCST